MANVAPAALLKYYNDHIARASNEGGIWFRVGFDFRCLVFEAWGLALGAWSVKKRYLFALVFVLFG